jgi:hypothetical protein
VIGRLAQGAVGERQRLSGPQFDALCDKVVELLCMLAVAIIGRDTGGSLLSLERPTTLMTGRGPA